jgi:hypothetical protein
MFLSFSAIYDRVSATRIHPVSLWVGLLVFASNLVFNVVIAPSSARREFAIWLIQFGPANEVASGDWLRLLAYCDDLSERLRRAINIRSTSARTSGRSVIVTAWPLCGARTCFV